jgi:signal transduction histidine kinase
MSLARRPENVKISVISESSQTQMLCREVALDAFGSTATLQCVSSPQPNLEADLYFWDIVPEPGILAKVAPEDNWRHFFFVESSEVERFRAAFSHVTSNVLLKPVGRAALKVFLMNAREQFDTVQTRSIQALQADRNDILQCLMQANLKLQEYDHDRTKFLARAIHDFRAPLTAISGYCSLLLGNDVGTLTEEQCDVIERMHRSAKKLSRMASAMFQLSIAPRTEAVIDLQRGDIRESIDHAMHEIMPVAEDKRLTVSAKTMRCPEPLHFDAMKIEQVVLNLLDNACKFAPRGGTIEIRGYPYVWEDHASDSDGAEMSADREPKSISNSSVDAMAADWQHKANSYRLDIRDTGPGIPPAHLPKIFEEYTSYGGGADRSGGGLGLAICRMILNQHKGRIWAESAHTGAVFSFVLPFHRPIGAYEQQQAFVRAVGAREC